MEVNKKTVILATIAGIWVVNKVCNAISNIKVEHHTVLITGSAMKQPKTSNKKKVESK